MAKNIIKELCEGGGYYLPFLLHIYGDDGTGLFVCNSNADIDYGGRTFKASAFKYQPASDGSASIEIDLIENHALINLVENSSLLTVDAVGVISDGEVTPVSTYRNSYGKASWDGSKLSIQLAKDDRGDMTFPALLWSKYNNRGNS